MSGLLDIFDTNTTTNYSVYTTQDVRKLDTNSGKMMVQQALDGKQSNAIPSSCRFRNEV